MSQLKKNHGDVTTATAGTTHTSATTTATAPAAACTNKSSAEKEVDKFLEQQKAAKKIQTIFPDLLVHLMGMGDADFWVNDIMGQVIPFLEGEAPADFQWVEHLEEGLPSAKFCDLDSLAKRLRASDKPNFQSKLKAEKEKDSETPFTFDVVYSVQALCKGLGIDDSAVNAYDFDKVNRLDFDKADRDRMQQKVLSELSFPGDGNAHFGFFLIFNAREQRFERRYGITNTSMMSCSTPDVVRSFFQINWEKVRANDGIKFTPEFYQQWMCMKDEMYSQYPIILDVLIQCMLDRYVAVGVNYAEFSVGVKDLVYRPWIFVHLSHPNAPAQFGQFQVPRVPPTITFRYLAAFNRCDVDKRCYWNEVDSLPEMTAKMALVFDENSGVKAEYFRKHLVTLDVIKRKFKESRDSNTNNIVSPLHEMCVGLDYVGDERRLPHCSFAHTDFITFLWDEREKRNGHFGFRIHAGEVQNPNELVQTVHMGVVSTVVCRILGQYCWLWKKHYPTMSEVPTNCPPPLRIANGMGFFADSQRPTSSTVPKTVVQFRTRIHMALSELRRLQIPLEVNPSGSTYLTGNPKAVSKMIFTLLANKFRVVVGSGNDGVCPTALENYHSVAAELIRVVRHFETGFVLQRHHVEALLKSYAFASFGHRIAVNSSPKEAKKQNNIVDDSSRNEPSVATVASTNTTSTAPPTSTFSADSFNLKPVVEYPTTAVAPTAQERRRSTTSETVAKNPHGALLVPNSEHVCVFFGRSCYMNCDCLSQRGWHCPRPVACHFIVPSPLNNIAISIFALTMTKPSCH